MTEREPEIQEDDEEEKEKELPRSENAQFGEVHDDGDLSSADEGCRDSGIALEKWDAPQQLLQAKTTSTATTADRIEIDSKAPLAKDTPPPITTATVGRISTTAKETEAFPSFSQLLYFTPESLGNSRSLVPYGCSTATSKIRLTVRGGAIIIYRSIQQHHLLCSRL